VVDLLSPIQARYAELRPDEAELERVLLAGAEKAAALAAPVLADVREVMGFGRPAPK
jgi:tryptophanyl-tRNA synthetase